MKRKNPPSARQLFMKRWAKAHRGYGAGYVRQYARVAWDRRNA
jgi:hypothetical protein